MLSHARALQTFSPTYPAGQHSHAPSLNNVLDLLFLDKIFGLALQLHKIRNT